MAARINTNTRVLRKLARFLRLIQEKWDAVYALDGADWLARMDGVWMLQGHASAAAQAHDPEGSCGQPLFGVRGGTGHVLTSPAMQRACNHDGGWMRANDESMVLLQ